MPIESSIEDVEKLEERAALVREFALSPDPTYIDETGETRYTLAGLETLATGVPAVAASLAAQDAQAASEAARDASQAAATLYPDEAAGRAAVADNVFYRVVGSGAIACYIYKRINSGTSQFIVALSSDEAVTKPSWAGRRSGWPDPFFRQFDLTSQTFLGRDRWYWNGVGAQFNGWSRVSNPVFSGYALRRTVSGNVPLNGPAVLLDEIGAAAGDTITIYALITGTGVVFGGYGRFYNDAEAAVGAQVVMQNDAGASLPTVTSTPVRMHFTGVVPAGSSRFHWYPITDTSGGTFDVVALWAFKGTATAGPVWPSFEEGDYLRGMVAEQKAIVSNHAFDISAAKGKADYAIIEKTAVTSSAEVITLDGAGWGTLARDLVFMGWGETYTPASVTFNALRIKYLSRAAAATAKWAMLRIVIRTGANPTAADAPVVAVGNAAVFPQDETLTDVTIVLKHPVTGEPITLSDASFSGGLYFVGVYAETGAGTPAACGEPLGTMANSAGQCYYHMSTINNPRAGAWTAATPGSNVRLAFQHLQLTGAVEGKSYTPSPEMKAALDAPSALPAPEIVVPPYLFGVEGRETNLYTDNIHLADAADYHHNIDSSGAVGAQQAERYTWTPAGALAAGTLTVTVHDKRTGAAAVSKIMQQRAAAANAGAGQTKSLLVIGDSLINAGVITQTLLDIAAADVMGITLLGTRGSPPNWHEGRGGWSVNDYCTVGRTYYKFTVAGIVTPPAINSSKYSNNGAVYTVQEYTLVGGAGTITCSVDSGGASQAAGTLTKTFGAGDAEIAFTASEAVSGNPFWIGGQLNFAQYLTNAGYAAPDWVSIALGINDIYAQTDDVAASAAADAAFAKLDLLIASIKTASASTKIALLIPTPPAASQDAFGANYGTGQTRWRDKRNILIWARQMILKYAGQEANRIYLVPSNLGLDTDNNYPRAAAEPVNSRNTAVQVSRQNNGVHPDASGYRQIADQLWAFLKFYA